MTAAGPPLVERHVVRVGGGGSVHLRAVAMDGDAGGDASAVPPLVLVHQSPLSSRRFTPLLAELGSWTRALAPDTPGYGDSPPLATETTVDDLAATLWAAIDAMAAGPVRILGRATGAVLAAAMTADRPDRVRHLVLHGVPLYTAEEAQSRLRDFAPPYVPDEEGTHLQWIWQRVRGEYPWAPPELVTSFVADYLAAGPDFATAYRAMWRYNLDDALRTIGDANVRTTLLAGGRDRIGFMHERARRRITWADERVLPEATDFVAEQDPVGFSRLLREVFAEEHLSGHER
ncbi:alpha/beta fold hydrolase [Nocardioides massiliensis]|uniref:Pimeloyl-ACP methyl ester carboxylesterase n=1 Tax=Nocardioides massiliensis TaxID=1325935 RepID=A0ABT9NNT7_9ACTN|nr:alpha/beta fold hydrolase [Nocardioides massiliensis]MDP9821864.1 pimeloyl-ACP methyl ester carboxylesterase [Nocardioides massiliensis]